MVHESQPSQVLITGAGGFLGTAIAARLRRLGIRVRGLSRRHYPRLDELGVEQVQGNIADSAAVARAIEGCDAVFHAAAKAGIWGPLDEYQRTNVEGTRVLLEQAERFHVRKLVYTSSPSVVFNGRELEGVDESTPYCRQFEAAYPRTKAQAEQMILAANGRDLATLSLRPHLVWGPGDNNLFPRIVARAQKGRLVKIGARDPLIDPVYIENAVDAHLSAITRLEPGSKVAGRVYFITQRETIRLWDMVNQFLAIAHLPPVSRSVARPLALAAAGLVELAYHVTRRDEEPPLTRFLVRQLSTSHWFNNEAAERDLGYRPAISIAQGMQLLAGDFHHKTHPISTDRPAVR